MYMKFRNRERGAGPLEFTKEEQETALMNQKPGAPDLSIMSFNGEETTGPGIFYLDRANQNMTGLGRIRNRSEQVR